MTRALIPCLLLAGASGLSAPGQPSHDETLYGRSLPYRRIESVGPCIDAEVAGDRLYAIGQGYLYVLDIAIPEEPRLLGRLPGLGATRQIIVRDSVAYITARQDGLWLVDVSDPAKPTLLSHYDTVEMATGIWVSGDLGFIATRQYGVEIVDVSDPRQVRHISTLKTGEAQSCWARDGLLYIGDWHPRKLLVADVSNPREPAIVGEALLDGYGDGGCLRGNICYAATGHHSRVRDREEAEGAGHGLELFDVSDPANPVFLSRVKFPKLYNIFNDMWSARVAGDYCVVADTNNGLFVVHVADPTQPRIVAHALFPPVARLNNLGDAVGGVALARDVIYAACIYSGLYVVSAPGLASPVVPEPDRAPALPPPGPAASDPRFHAYRPEGQVRAVHVQDDVAWTACGAAGLHAVRLGENGIEPLAVHRPGHGVYYVSRVGDRLFTAEGEGGMAIYDIGPDLQLAERGRLTIPRNGVRQVVVPHPGEFGLLHCGGSQAYVVDLRNPEQPAVVLRDSQVGLFYGDQLVDHLFAGRYLVAYWQRGGPAWYDIAANPPVHVGNTPDTTLYSFTNGACPYGESLLVVKHGRYHLLEPNEPRNTSDLPAYGVEGLRLEGWPRTDGRTLALSSRHNRRVLVLDIADITQPRFKRQYDLVGHPGACAFWNGRILVPAGYQGLLLERD